MTSPTPKKIAIIITSTRAVRVGPVAVEVIQKVLKSSPSYASVEFTVIDLAKFNLPIFDEKMIPAAVPAHGQFEHEHTKAWSAAIAPYDGYIFPTPEYNFGPPGGVKNAIDYLYNEWIGKPILIVGYGILGGVHATSSLKVTFEGMKLRVVRTIPHLTFVGGGYGPDTQGAVATGALGDESRKAWEANEDIGKGFEELVELINDPEKKGSEADKEPVVAA